MSCWCQRRATSNVLLMTTTRLDWALSVAAADDIDREERVRCLIPIYGRGEPIHYLLLVILTSRIGISISVINHSSCRHSNIDTLSVEHDINTILLIEMVVFFQLRDWGGRTVVPYFIAAYDIYQNRKKIVTSILEIIRQETPFCVIFWTTDRNSKPKIVEK